MNPSTPLAFCLSPLDRAEDIRRNADRLAELQTAEGATAIPFRRADPVIGDNGRLARWPMGKALTLKQVDTPILLGLENGEPLYAVDVDPDAEAEGADFTDTRTAAMQLPIEETGILAQARSLIEWRRKNRFCSNCGTLTTELEAGRKRLCMSCGTEHFPRVDPVAIMLVVKDDWCLLGRQSSWPPRMWSALAGFMEPGETIAQAAAREVWEEAGLQCDPASAELIADQPWPFASSLMLAVIIEAITVDIKVDTHEIESARWFSREEIHDMLSGQHPEADVPPSIAIARRLLEVWVSR
ncbi:NAD(+) diphosphatase [Hyphobacterium sp. HN65]|uniref:NAD(+) diphosphatase n=1 Tax=Hyphobacterium lacteum TaxID=3116575 RepID=A0ABU7LNK6_9PROT|nr:NAD(+) diphosphatase [Hyphobacterium sp. HN65]MEE2525500.1 NAD(+) diphosphatase [Hyphobacterium sp. HN65]